MIEGKHPTIIRLLTGELGHAERELTLQGQEFSYVINLR